MITEQGKYVNKEPLLAAAVTRLCLGEQSLLLFSFSLVRIDSLCAALGQLVHCTTKLLRVKQRCASKASSTVLNTFFLSFQNDFHLPTFFPDLSCPRSGSLCADWGHRSGSCWRGDAFQTSHGWWPGGLTALAIRSYSGAKPLSTAVGRKKSH